MSSKGAEDVLRPILIDYRARDGSTLRMRLLSSSPQIAVGGGYPFEQKYFAYLHKWASVVDEKTWPKRQWNPPRNLGTIGGGKESWLVGLAPWMPRDVFDP